MIKEGCGGRGKEGLKQIFCAWQGCRSRVGSQSRLNPPTQGVEVVGKLVSFVVLVVVMVGGAIVEGIVALDLVGRSMQLRITVLVLVL